MKRATSILDAEGVSHIDDKSLANLIMKHAPDWRRILNELQRHSMVGIDSDRSDSNVLSYSSLFDYLKSKDFKKMRSWVAQNVDADATAIFRAIYDQMNEKIKPESIPQLVLILADYSYKNAFVADHELNTVACMTEIMANVDFV